MRSTREELIRKGVLKEADDNQENHVNKLGKYKLLFFNFIYIYIYIYIYIF